MRSLLIWLLVLAVPAQAIAAASTAVCGTDHHPAAPARQQAHLAGAAKGSHAHQLKAEKASDANDATADESADESAADLPAPAKAVQAEKQNDNQNDNQKCSVCASCCSVGVILSAMAHLVAPEFAAAEFVSVVPAVPAVAAGSPDRPPRSANA